MYVVFDLIQKAKRLLDFHKAKLHFVLETLDTTNTGAVAVVVGDHD